MTREIMIVAGEASGDLHGSRLVQAMTGRRSDLHFVGVGGTEMAAAGVELLFPSSRIAVVGLLEVLSHLGPILSAQRLLRRRLSERRPALLILIDFPDFNLLLARKAKKLGIPVFYYISPQVWAWRSGRVKTIGRLVDAIGVILPFEQEFYRARGVNAHYVGHPLLDSVRPEMSREAFCASFSLDPSRQMIGIVPGSREREIRHLLPVFLEAAARFQQRNETRPLFLVPRASTISEAVLAQNGIDRYRDILDIRIIAEYRYALMAACEAVVAASGTVTLELLLLDTPQVAAYRLAPVSYAVGKMLVKVPFFSLVNLIAGEEIVTELLQEQVNSEQLAEALQQLVYDRQRSEQIRTAYTRVRQILGSAGASQRAADLALRVLENPVR